MLIERRDSLSGADFIERFLSCNTPVIVTDAQAGRPAATTWSIEFFARKFGDRHVQVYDNLFSLRDLVPLSDYIQRNFGPTATASDDYVRWYAKFRDVDFVWSDDVFAELKGDWERPRFFPSTGFVLPFVQAPSTTTPTAAAFPYTGLFISGRHSRTRLHVDPLGSCAILYQVAGRKAVTLFSPADAQYLRAGEALIDIHEPDDVQFPDFRKARPLYSDTLAAGETLFIPSGWPHDVVTLEDSVSLTWNFVHSADSTTFHECLRNRLSETDESVLRFYLPREFYDGQPTDRLHALLEKAAGAWFKPRSH
jgi:hypothetical protein